MLVLDAIEDETAVEINKLAHLWHCSAAQLTEWDEKEEKFEFHRIEASKAFKDIGRTLLPWYKRWDESDRRLEDLWKTFKDQEKDPEFQKWRSKEVAKLNKMADDFTSRAKAIETVFERKAKAEREKQEAERRRRIRAGLRRATA